MGNFLCNLNSSLNSSLNFNNDNKQNNLIESNRNLFIILFGLFICAYLYYDIVHHKFILVKFLATIFNENVMIYMLKVFGAYGIVQVFAQDIGIKTGKFQRNLTHNIFIQFLLYWGGAYAMTGDLSEGMIAAFIYLYLRNVVSKEKMDVCFE